MLNPSLPPVVRSASAYRAATGNTNVVNGKFEFKAPAQQAPVQFGGVISGFKKMFRAFGAWWNGMGNKAQEKQAIAIFQEKREGLGSQKNKARDIAATMEGRARREASKLESMKSEFDALERSAQAADKAASEQTDTKVQEALLKKAKEQGTKLFQLEADLQLQEKRSNKARQEANIAKARLQQIEKSLENADRVLQDAQNKVRQAELNEEAAKMSTLLNELQGIETVSSDDTAQLLNSIEDRLHKSEALLDGNQSAEDIAAQVKAEEVLRKADEDDVLTKLRQRREGKGKTEATQSQTSTTTGPKPGNRVLDHLDGDK